MGRKVEGRREKREVFKEGKYRRGKRNRQREDEKKIKGGKK